MVLIIEFNENGEFRKQSKISFANIQNKFLFFVVAFREFHFHFSLFVFFVFSIFVFYF